MALSQRITRRYLALFPRKIYQYQMQALSFALIWYKSLKSKYPFDIKKSLFLYLASYYQVKNKRLMQVQSGIIVNNWHARFINNTPSAVAWCSKNAWGNHCWSQMWRKNSNPKIFIFLPVHWLNRVLKLGMYIVYYWHEF